MIADVENAEICVTGFSNRATALNPIRAGVGGAPVDENTRFHSGFIAPYTLCCQLAHCWVMVILCLYNN